MTNPTLFTVLLWFDVFGEEGSRPTTVFLTLTESLCHRGQSDFFTNLIKSISSYLNQCPSHRSLFFFFFYILQKFLSLCLSQGWPHPSSPCADHLWCPFTSVNSFLFFFHDHLSGFQRTITRGLSACVCVSLANCSSVSWATAGWEVSHDRVGFIWTGFSDFLSKNVRWKPRESDSVSLRGPPALVPPRPSKDSSISCHTFIISLLSISPSDNCCTV